MQENTELPEANNVLDILLEMTQLSHLAQESSSEVADSPADSAVRRPPHSFQLRMRLENEDFDDLINRPDGIDLV